MNGGLGRSTRTRGQHHQGVPILEFATAFEGDSTVFVADMRGPHQAQGLFARSRRESLVKDAESLRSHGALDEFVHERWP